MNNFSLLPEWMKLKSDLCFLESKARLRWLRWGWRWPRKQRHQKKYKTWQQPSGSGVEKQGTTTSLHPTRRPTSNNHPSAPWGTSGFFLLPPLVTGVSNLIGRSQRTRGQRIWRGAEDNIELFCTLSVFADLKMTDLKTTVKRLLI